MQKVSTGDSTKQQLIGLILVVVTIAVYAQVRHFDFLRFDDQDFVYNKTHITSGLTGPDIAWALTTHDVGNYVPLTRLSWMLDVSLFGLNPGAFHLENVLLHVINSLLIFALLRKATGDLWPSAFVAFVCALHPVRTESVAWVAERKDVLSTMFALLTMLLYVRWTREIEGGRRRGIYLLMCFCFVLAMLAKQMLVTIPFVLMLMDYWPLNRGGRGIWKLTREKIPLLAITVAGVLISYLAASEVVISAGQISVLTRIENAFVSYARYLLEVFWPVHLSPFYPFRRDWPASAVILCPLLLVLMTAVCIGYRRRRPYLLVGWLWFLGVLVPSIGLVQVGEQSIADRWLYVPMIGLAIMVAWSGADLASIGPTIRRAVLVVAMAILIVLGVLSRRQLSYWKNTRTLFAHALSVINSGPAAHMQIGALAEREGDRSTAIAEYQQAALLAPDDFEPEYDLGNLLLDTPDRAIPHFQRALVLRPHDARVENNLGVAFARSHRPDRAFDLFQAAIADDPAYAEPHANLGLLLESAGKNRDAAKEFAAALRIDPQNQIAIAGQKRVAQNPNQTP
jgi:hypothetical protein